MNGKITIQLDKESIQRLEKDATEWGLSIEDYARILLRGNRPAFMNMTAEEKEALQETMKILLNLQKNSLNHVSEKGEAMKNRIKSSEN